MFLAITRRRSICKVSSWVELESIVVRRLAER